MANSYSWTINQMNAHIESDGEDNLIYTVHWTYTALSSVEMPAGGAHYSASSVGAQGFVYVKGNPFVPYENTEAFENVVIGWLEGSLDVPAMQASIAATIQSEITPVNEDLYFTWQNPVPPVPPVEEEEKEEEAE